VRICCNRKRITLTNDAAEGLTGQRRLQAQYLAYDAIGNCIVVKESSGDAPPFDRTTSSRVTNGSVFPERVIERLGNLPKGCSL
jgi:hypothetical protein